MTQEERVVNLVKLYCYYMTQFHKTIREVHYINNMLEAEYTIAMNKIEHLRKVYIDPILDMLEDEGVHILKNEDGKTKVLMKDYTEIEVDAVVEKPFAFNELNNS